MSELNEPIAIAPGPFRLIGEADARLNSALRFRWTPTTAIEFDGTYEHALTTLDAEKWTLQADGPKAFSVEVIVTRGTIGGPQSHVRGIANGPFSFGHGPIEQLRFSLVNFPDYLGQAVQISDGRGFARVRLDVSSESGRCVVDEIDAAKQLTKEAGRDAGYFLSHVGVWYPATTGISTSDADDVLRMLHFWFGFLRGAWAGPVFPEGLVASQPTWYNFSPWKLPESREVPTGSR